MFFKPLTWHCVTQSGNNNGFTIIEVLIAITILAIGILALAKMQITSVHGNGSARKYTEASTFGVSRIESIMSATYASAALANGTTGSVVQGIYTINWTVTDADPVLNVKRINVRVTWAINKSFTADYYKAI